MIDPSKKYRTRDGREVRIYAVDAGGQKPVHGARRGDDGQWVHECWTDDGNVQRQYYAMPNAFDLIEVKPEVTVSWDISLIEGAMMFGARGQHGWLGTISITHDGEKLINVEIVK